ncbi:MAG: MFS transporter [Candidatus Latescibacteria bacterium]|jgi:MFS family permease|nr:hypothetical protein [Gemmatimonadaceae bacterium]MDP7448492.1 MFS transporter [Candidatus Latescibacterota bacterium]HJP32429.1 MFS transporter [Candidatus Latescibacterota bacterium]
MNSFLFRLYSHCFVDELMLIYPFYAVMFVDHGLSPMELATLLAVWCATTIVLEVPSGVLADRHSRKAIMVFGAVLRACGYTCWALFPSFWGFLVGFVLWGIEGALGSGAFEALVYDELKRFGRQDDYARVQGRCRGLGQAGIVAASLAASWVVSSGYEILIAASAAAALAAGGLLLSLPTAPPVAPTGATGWAAYAVTLRAGVGEVVLRPYVRHLVLFATVALSLGGTLEEYWPILAVEIGLPEYAPGVLLAVLCGTQALASFMAHRFVDLSSRTVFSVFAACGAGLFVAAWSMHPAAILLVVLFVFVFQAIDIVYDARLQAVIPSEHRATASSVKGFASEVAGIPVVMAMGIAVTDRSYRLGFEAFGVAIVLVGVCYLLRAGRLPRPADADSRWG